MAEEKRQVENNVPKQPKKKEMQQEEKKKENQVSQKKAPQQQSYTIPTITKPPIFQNKKQLINFFSQESISLLRPLGRIVGLAPGQPKEEIPKEEVKIESEWNMANMTGKNK